ncbi:MAG: VOC family protein [Candidatus Lambdaproteobacteria bacterium]|nr:VOC family protein [Candidatus Lambdaproteobacteria bacterium]
MHPPATSPGFESVAAALPGLLYVDHVAIAVPRGTLEQHVAAYAGLGFREVHRETLGGTDNVTEVMLQIGASPNMIQLVEPGGPDSPVQKALDRNGGRGGLSHVAFRVADIHAAYRELAGRGYRMLDAAPRRGTAGTLVFFIHPKSPAATPLDVLIEIVQAP